MSSSAVNSDDIILPGMPLVVSGGFAKLANTDSMATALALDGAPSRGVVTYDTSGIISRQDWNAVVGSNLLVVGATYYVSGKGKLAPSGQGQAVGIAVGTHDLEIHISHTKIAATYTLAAPQFERQILDSTRDPSYWDGDIGQYWINVRTGGFFGPKTHYGWPPAMYFVT